MNDRATTTRIRPLLMASALLLTMQQTGVSSPDVQQSLATADAAGGLVLLPTAHPEVPESLDALWYAPAAARARSEAKPSNAPLASFAAGVRLLEQGGDAAAALPLVSASALQSTDVAPYARYYTGVALQRLDRLPEAEATFARVVAEEKDGYLPIAAALGVASVRESRGDYAGALAAYETLAQKKVAAPQVVWLKLAQMAELAGRQDLARDAFRFVIDRFPLTQEAVDAELGLERINGFDLTAPGMIAKELVRADALFAARRNGPATAAYERLKPFVDGDDRALVEIRLATLAARDGRARAARDVLRRYVNHKVHGIEARFALLGVTRALGEKSEYRSMVRAFVDAYPSSPLAEEALNDLGTHLILEDEDAQAAAIFRDIADRYPTGRFGERAAWKAGWWAYRQDNYAEAIRMFERGAASFPRSDYRPAWLYWSARAYDALGNREMATERYRLTVTDYQNIYYGRLALKKLKERGHGAVTPGVRRAIAEPPPPPPGVERIARLIELELYHPALAELQYVQAIHGGSAPLQATIAFVQHKLGNLRFGINAMKRAYPQYMAAGGENLPREILEVIFPLDYWPTIQKLAREQGLDPYLVAALVAQESSFDTGIRSSANAIGLMQVLPSTGRRYASRIGIRSFSPTRLTDPEVNARIGTLYLAELVRMFDGKVHYAIASYNAGENRVKRWRAERGDLEPEEFIDDIPYPETQNYVKRILGTAEDYRRLYGNGQTPPAINRPIPGTSLSAVRPMFPVPAKEPAAQSPPKSTPAKAVTTKPAATKPAPGKPASKKPAPRRKSA
jgi:soluble lytic murein transglycosylase